MYGMIAKKSKYVTEKKIMVDSKKQMRLYS